MIAVLSKPVDQIDVNDVDELIGSQGSRERADRVQGDSADKRWGT